jgi:hypothetical protein
MVAKLKFAARKLIIIKHRRQWQPIAIDGVNYRNREGHLIARVVVVVVVVVVFFTRTNSHLHERKQSDRYTNER